MFLNNPFPAQASFATTVRFSFFAGLVVFLILYLFRPFNIDGPANHFTLLHPLIYGLATFLMVMLNALLLPVALKQWYREERWTLGKEILSMCWQIISISFINLVITHFLFGEPLNFANVLKFLLITFSVGIFPVSFILLIKQQLLYKKFARGALALEENLQVQEPAVEKQATGALVAIRGDNLGEELSLHLEDIRYITAADNYIKIIYLSGNQPVAIIIRSTLKKVEGMLAGYPNLFRCHRAYIVNLSSVRHISGNAQGYKLHLTDTEDLIPVSRSLNEEIGVHLKNYSTISR